MTSPERFHAFDALRAAMMALGVVIHSATMYSTIPDVWWIKDPATGRAIDCLILFLHAFRLPAFFVMAGFFAGLLVHSRGWQSAVENRMARLGLPFLLGMIFLYPPLRLVNVYFHLQQRDAQGWSALLDWVARGRLAETLEPGHFWFLETLLLVILMAAACRRWITRLSGRWFLRLLGTRWGILPLAVCTAATLMLSPFGVLDTPHGFSPHFHVVAAYAVFFAFGWGLWEHRTSLDHMRHYGLPEIAVALVLMLPGMDAIAAQLARPTTRLWLPFATTAVSTALIAWLMIYGLTGLFLRYCAEPSERWRYYSDAAYFVYLAHPLVLVAIQLPMMHMPWNEWIKFTACLVVSFPVLLWIYDRAVRSTWVGVVLNGKRLPRWIRPTPDPAPQPASILPG
ncbi:MAG: acyltransferase family protein [Bryobacterales bacterium]|nr:acyltransferase family protein [Bryobacterales bacterium]